MAAALGFVGGLFGFGAGAAFASGAAAFGGWVAGAAFGGTFLGGIAVKLLTTVAVSALSQALTPDPPQGGGITISATVHGEDKPETIILGRYATGGQAVAAPYSHGKSNRYLTHVIELCSAPGAKLERVMVGDGWAELGETPHGEFGYPVLGEYDGHVWVKYYDGTQTAVDQMMHDRYGNHGERPWTADMIGTGICYAILTFRYDQEDLPQVPRYRFELSGIPLYDIRKDDTAGGSGSHRLNNQATWEQTENAAVIAWNIMRGIPLPGGDVWGGNITDLRALPTSVWIAAMNRCDAPAELEGGETEPAYRAGIEVALDQPPAAALEEIFKACSGTIADLGYGWGLTVGAPALPVYSFTDDDIIVSRTQEMDPFPAIQDTYNAVSAKYPDPEHLWETKDAPQRTDAALEAADAFGRRSANLSLPAAPYAMQVQRLMLAWLNDERRFRRHVISLPPDAAHVELIDTINWSSERNGYAGKDFSLYEVLEDPRTGIRQFSIRERDPADYSWQPSFALPSAPAAALPTPLLPVSVPGFGAEAVILTDADGVGRRPGIRLFWDPETLARGLKWQIRREGEVEAGISGDTQDIGAGQRNVFSGILPLTTYFVRGRLVSDRPTEWSGWYEVTTGDVGLTIGDLAQEVLDEMKDTAEKAGVTPVEVLPASGEPNQIVMKVPEGILYRWDEASGQWSESIYAGIADGAINDIAKFAQGIEPVTIIDPADPLPATKLTEAISWQGTLYKWDGAAYVSTEFELTPGSVESAHIADLAVTAIKLRDNAVTAAKIAAGAVDTTKLAAAAVTRGKIVDAAIDAAKLADGAATAAKIAASAVTGDKLADAAVSGAKIAAGAVDALKLANGAVTETKISDGAISTPKLQAGAIGADQIAANAIVASKIAVGDFTNLVPAADWRDLAAWAVTNATAAAIQVTPGGFWDTDTFLRITNTDAYGQAVAGRVPAKPGDQLLATCRARIIAGTGSVRLRVFFYETADQSAPTVIEETSSPSASLTTLSQSATVPANCAFVAVALAVSGAAGDAGQFNAVSLRRKSPGELIVDGAITAGKIAAASVDASKLTAGSVTTAKLAANAVQAGNIAAAAIQTAHIAAGAVVAGSISSNAITSDKITSGAVNTDKLAANAVTAAKITAGAIGADQIAAGAIVSAKIAAGAVATTHLAADAVTAGKIAADAVTADKITANAITAAKISAGAVGADQIAANAIIASKIAVGDGTNLAPSPDWRDMAAWSVTNATTTLTGVVPGAYWSTDTVLQITNTSSYGQATGRKALVKPGDELLASVLARVVPGSSGTARVRLRVFFYQTIDQALPTSVAETSTDATGLTALTQAAVVPSDCAFAAVALAVSGSAADAAQFNAVSLRRKSPGELIVDGAVTASKIAAGAITANGIAAGAIVASKIAAGAVTADKITVSNLAALGILVGTADIANAAITTAKISDLSVDTIKIADGAVTKFGDAENQTGVSTNNTATPVMIVGFTWSSTARHLFAASGRYRCVANTGGAATVNVKIFVDGLIVATETYNTDNTTSEDGEWHEFDIPVRWVESAGSHAVTVSFTTGGLHAKVAAEVSTVRWVK